MISTAATPVAGVRPGQESQGADLVHAQDGLQQEDVVVRLVGEHRPLLLLLLAIINCGFFMITTFLINSLLHYN